MSNQLDLPKLDPNNYWPTHFKHNAFNSMTQRIFVFKTTNTTSDGRPYLLAIPEKQITEVRSVIGNTNTQAIVNGTRVNYSFTELVKKLGTSYHCY
jgi:hypothetical protein